MSWTLLGAFVALVLWVLLIFVFPLGPSGSAAHLLLGVAGVLFVRWWALRDGAAPRA
ncbi:MAG TPA: hypothetical protein VMG41_03340 [Gemmatimonadales bacterium]|nr:hypothetical protein [Gemmatimonadales bacterium]